MYLYQNATISTTTGVTVFANLTVAKNYKISRTITQHILHLSNKNLIEMLEAGGGHRQESEKIFKTTATTKEWARQKDTGVA